MEYRVKGDRERENARRKKKDLKKEINIESRKSSEK